MYNVGMDKRNPHPDPCGNCASADWADATDEQYAAVVARMRSERRDDGAGDFSPDRLLVCAGCGATRIALVTTFHTS